MLHINVVGISSIDWIRTMKLRNEYKKVRNVYRQKDEGRITDEDWKRAGQEVEKFKRAVRDTGRAAERSARTLGIEKNKKVPSQNPTAGGGSASFGKSWENHKYIDKVRTKSGKIRYIYDDISTASGKHRNVVEENDKKKADYNKKMQEGKKRRRAQDKHDIRMKHDIPYRVQHEAQTFINNVMDNVKNTPISKFFK